MMDDKTRRELVLQTGRELVVCEVPGCGAEFFYVESRRWPYRCLDHADDFSRLVDGWTPENSLS